MVLTSVPPASLAEALVLECEGEVGPVARARGTLGPAQGVAFLWWQRASQQVVEEAEAAQLTVAVQLLVLVTRLRPPHRRRVDLLGPQAPAQLRRQKCRVELRASDTTHCLARRA